MKRAIITGFALIVGLASAQAFARGPENFSIRRMVYAGSGCPAGTIAENVSPDLEAFTLLFDSYYAEAGQGVPLSASRKNCQINIEFDCPAGWKYAILDLDTRGYAALESGVKGIQQTSFYYQGQSQTGSVARTFEGPFDGDYQVRDVLPAAGRQWGTCGPRARSLNINTSIRVDNLRNRRASGLMTVDSVDGSLVQTYGIIWERE